MGTPLIVAKESAFRLLRPLQAGMRWHAFLLTGRSDCKPSCIYCEQDVQSCCCPGRGRGCSPGSVAGRSGQPLADCPLPAAALQLRQRHHRRARTAACAEGAPLCRCAPPPVPPSCAAASSAGLPCSSLKLQIKVALCQLSVGADKQANLATARSAIDEAAGAGALRCIGVGCADDVQRIAPCSRPHARVLHAHVADALPAMQAASRCSPTACLCSHPGTRRVPASLRIAAGAHLVVLPEMWNCPYSNDSFPVYAEDLEGGDAPSAAMLAAAAAEHRVVLVRRGGMGADWMGAAGRGGRCSRWGDGGQLPAPPTAQPACQPACRPAFWSCFYASTPSPCVSIWLARSLALPSCRWAAASQSGRTAACTTRV